MEFMMRYDADTNEYSGAHSVLVTSILRLSKPAGHEGELTFIHLHNGETLVSTDSVNTLEARINSMLREINSNKFLMKVSAGDDDRAI